MDEAHSAFIRSAASRASVRVSHDIAYVECCATFARRRRDGSLASDDHVRCRRQLDRDWERFSVIAVTADLILRAAVLVEDHALRAYDGVHLAAAESAASVVKRRIEFRFAAFEAKLLVVAQSNNLSFLTPD